MKGNLKNWQIVFYSMGGESYMVVFALTSWVMYGYCPPEGKGVQLVSLAVFSTITTLARVLEAALNPVVGFISDNARTPWGRRIPFILIGALLTTFAIVMISRPPVASGIDLQNTLYFSFFFILMTVASLVMYQPVLALGPEITADNSERVKVASITLFMGVVVGLVNLTQGIAFEKLGFANMTAIFGLMVFLLALGPVISINEERDVIKRHKMETNSPKISFTRGLYSILSNRIFIIFALANSVQMLAFVTLIAVAPYLLTEIAGKKPGDVAVVGLFFLGGMVMGIPSANWMTKRYCKKSIFAWSVLVGSVLFFLMTFLILVPGPAVYPVILAFSLVYSFVFMFTNTVKAPMLADIILLDCQISGERKEALFIGTHGLIFRIIDSANIPITAGLFAIFGYSSNSPMGIYLVFPVCAVINLLSFFIIRHFPLDDQGSFLKEYEVKYHQVGDTIKKTNDLLY
ncbi:MAG: MFS transporter [Desulfocucumaceae bacterium]